MLMPTMTDLVQLLQPCFVHQRHLLVIPPNNTDCNDANVSVHAPQTYYRDADGDGYGSSVTTNVCSSHLLQVIQQEPAIAMITILLLTRAQLKYVVMELMIIVMAKLMNSLVLFARMQQDLLLQYYCYKRRLNWNSVANPVQWQVQYKTTNLGAKWVDVLLTGDKRSVTISPLLAKQNYIWHIRAKCGKTWTALFRFSKL
jgi:hypothetical protein